jgi:hypothetical protein
MLLLFILLQLDSLRLHCLDPCPDETGGAENIVIQSKSVQRIQ